MSNYNFFLSVVFTVENKIGNHKGYFIEAFKFINGITLDNEIIIVDTSSEKSNNDFYREITSEGQVPNLHVYILNNFVDSDTSSWVGLENAIGDYIAVLNPFIEDYRILPELLRKMKNETNDIVIAKNTAVKFPFPIRILSRMFKLIFGKDAVQFQSNYKIFSRLVINFIEKHPHPSIIYKSIHTLSGFETCSIDYFTNPIIKSKINAFDKINKGLRFTINNSLFPMRFVTLFSVFGATANLMYSLYVLFVHFYRDDIAAGWTSMSLQLSGMFFLISIVLFILGEYFINITKLSVQGPLYLVVKKYKSTEMTSKQRLNIEESGYQSNKITE